MEDDTKLKVILWLMIIMSAIALIGLWECFIKPVSIFVWQLIGPYIISFFQLGIK